jgi:hypothetical protein
MFLTAMYTFDFRTSRDGDYQQYRLYDTASMAQESREAYIASHWEADVSEVYAVEA